MPLKTNYTNDVLDTAKNRERKYNITENTDGSVSLRDVTVYTQEGTVFGASDMNATNLAVNNANENIATLRNSVSNISDNLTSRGIQFRFAINGEGKYGYLGADDSFNPFNRLPKEIRVSYYAVCDVGSYHGKGNTQTAVFTRQSDDTFKLTSGGSAYGSSYIVTHEAQTVTVNGSAYITDIEFVYD